MEEDPHDGIDHRLDAHAPRVDHHRAHHVAEDSGFDLRVFDGEDTLFSTFLQDRLDRCELDVPFFTPALAVFAPAVLALAVLLRHQAEEEAVLAEEGDDGVDHPAEFLFGILLAVGVRLELLVEAGDAVEDHREVESLLVGKVRVDRPLADAGLLGDVVHQHFVEALGREEAGRLLDDLFFAVGFGHG